MCSLTYACVDLCAAEDIREAKRQDRLAAEAAENERLKNEAQSSSIRTETVFDRKDPAGKAKSKSDLNEISVDVNVNAVSSASCLYKMYGQPLSCGFPNPVS